MAEKKDYKVVGTRPIRHDGLDKVTGRALYGADFQAVGLLHGKVLRSPYAHARIKSIDTSRAEAHPGVRAVVTAKDFPAVENKIADLGEGATNVKDLQDNVLAGEKALYKGHQVAAVAAIDPHTAEEALELIDVEYEVLPPVVKVLDAMKEDAPLLHEDMRTDEMGKRRISRATLRLISSTNRATSTEVLPKPMLSLSTTIQQRPCIKAISSLTMRLRCTTPMDS